MTGAIIIQGTATPQDMGAAVVEEEEDLMVAMVTAVGMAARVEATEVVEETVVVTEGVGSQVDMEGAEHQVDTAVVGTEVQEGILPVEVVEEKEKMDGTTILVQEMEKDKVGPSSRLT